MVVLASIQNGKWAMEHLLPCLVVLRREGSRLEECQEGHGESMARGKVQPAVGPWHDPSTGWENIISLILTYTEQTQELSGLLFTPYPWRKVSHGSVFYHL